MNLHSNVKHNVGNNEERENFKEFKRKESQSVKRDEQK